jgi:hypothetical protein
MQVINNIETKSSKNFLFSIAPLAQTSILTGNITSYCVDDIQCEKLDKSEFRCFVPTLTLTSGNTSSTIDPNIRVCQHKRLWPWSGKDIGTTYIDYYSIIFLFNLIFRCILGGSLIIFFGGMLAAGAGVGGGGLFVPILILILEFTTKTAIPLSNASSSLYYAMIHSAY